MQKHRYAKSLLCLLLTVILMLANLPTTVFAGYGEIGVARSASSTAKTTAVKSAAVKAAKKAKAAQKLAKASQKVLSKAKQAKSISKIGGYKLPKTHKAKLARAIKTLTKDGYSVSAVMLDLKTNRGIAYNIGKKFYSASTIKGPYIAALAKLKPKSLKSSKLAMLSTVAASSNDSYNALTKRYGKEVLRKWCKSSTAKLSFYQGAYIDFAARYSAKNLAKLWAENYQYFLSGTANAKIVRSWFQAPKNSMIRAVFKGKNTTYSKPGWIAGSKAYSSMHDAGIVMAGKNPYLLVILTNTPAQSTKLKPIIKALDTVHNDIIEQAAPSTTSLEPSIKQN